MNVCVCVCVGGEGACSSSSSVVHLLEELVGGVLVAVLLHLGEVALLTASGVTATRVVEMTISER